MCNLILKGCRANRAGDTVTVDGWSKTDQVVGGRPVWMSPETAVDDSMVDDARVTLDAAGHPAVLVTLDSEGAARLQELTTRRTSRPVVVVVDLDDAEPPGGFHERVTGCYMVPIEVDLPGLVAGRYLRIVAEYRGRDGAVLRDEFDLELDGPMRTTAPQ